MYSSYALCHVYCACEWLSEWLDLAYSVPDVKKKREKKQESKDQSFEATTNPEEILTLMDTMTLPSASIQWMKSLPAVMLALFMISRELLQPTLEIKIPAGKENFWIDWTSIIIILL